MADTPEKVAAVVAPEVVDTTGADDKSYPVQDVAVTKKKQSLSDLFTIVRYATSTNHICNVANSRCTKSVLLWLRSHLRRLPEQPHDHDQCPLQKGIPHRVHLNRQHARI